MRMLATVLIAACLWPAAAQAQPEKPARIIVEERFGSAIRKALATRPTDDDLSLAEELLTIAKDPATSGDMLAELADQTFLLASRDALGTDLALEAMNLVATTLPDKAAGAREKAIQFLRRSVSVADGPVRIAAATRLMEYLEKLAEDRAAASDFGGAAKMYQQAMLAAGDAKLPDLSTLKAKFDAASAREKLELRIELAIEALAKNPVNATASSELVQIYTVELDNPTAASRYTKYCNDEKAKRLVPLAAGKLDALTSEQSMELGEWYEKLSSEALVTSRPALMKRARAYYEQFLLLPGSDSIQQLRASLGIARARDAWMKLNPVEAEQLAIPDERGWVDLLKGMEVPRYRVTGRWKRVEETLTVDASDAPARMMLTASATEAYELSLRFNRLKGDGAISIILPVGEQSCRLVLSGWHGKASGLYSIEGDETADLTTGIRRNSTTTNPGPLSNSTEHRLTIRVINQGDDVTITAMLDDKDWLSWKGARSRLSVEKEWSLRNDRAIGLGADFGNVQFSALQLRSLRGDARLITKPPTLLERGTAAPADGFVDLLELWDATGDTISGSWVRSGDAIGVDRRPDTAQTLLPIIPRGNYVLRVKLERKGKRPGPVAISLPMFDTSVIAILGGGANGNTHGLAMVDAKDYTTNVTTRTGPALPAEVSIVECRASFEEDQAKIEIDLNGESLIRWSGPRTQLTAPPAMTFKGGAQPGLGMGFSEVTYHAVELKMLTGSARFTRAPANKPVMVDATPVDLFKHLNLGRHTTAGTWQAGQGQINTTVALANGQSSIMLPVALEGNYELDLKFARTLGRAVVTVYLPVGTAGGVDLVLASADGKVGSLSAGPPRDGGGGANQTSSSATRFVNNTLYNIHAKVESKAGDATIKIELDGKPYLHWSGPLSSLSARTMPTTHNSRAVGIAVVNPVVRSGVAIHDAQIKMTSGQAKPLK